MKTKTYLQQLRKLDTLIRQKTQELNELREMSALCSIDYSKEAVQSSTGNEAGFVKGVFKIVDLEQEINAAINRFIYKKHTIINQIQALENPNHVEVLYKRYVEFKTLEAIAVEMNYTYHYVLEMHGYALQVFTKTYKNL